MKWTEALYICCRICILLPWASNSFAWTVRQIRKCVYTRKNVSALNSRINTSPLDNRKPRNHKQQILHLHRLHILLVYTRKAWKRNTHTVYIFSDANYCEFFTWIYIFNLYVFFFLFSFDLKPKRTLICIGISYYISIYRKCDQLKTLLIWNIGTYRYRSRYL